MKLLTLFRGGVAVLALAAFTAGAEPAPPWRVCLDAEDPPFGPGGAVASGFHADLARALAERLGRPLQWVTVAVPNRGGLPKALRGQLLAGRCEAWLGLPLGPEMQAELSGLGLRLSAPYLGLGYRWVAGPGQPAPTADRVARARGIGVVSATPADLELHRRHLPRLPHGDAAALLAGLRAGTLDLALLWSPALGRPEAEGLLSSGEGLEAPALRTALALGLRAADHAQVEALDAALAALRAEGVLDGLRRTHRLPEVPVP